MALGKFQWSIFKQSLVLPGTFGLFMFNILMEILGLLFTKSLCLSLHPMYFFHDLYAVFSCVYFKEIIIHFILFL